MDSMSQASIGYELPPVVQRVITVLAEMDDELYESKFDEWRAIVEENYAIYEPLKEWTLQVEEKGGIPLLNDIKPEVKITPRFSKKRSNDGFDWSIRCPYGQFTMNMHSEPGSTRRFSCLRKEFDHWFHLWVKHFEVSKITSIKIHYVNELSLNTIPDFTNEDKSINIAEVLTVFVHIPGRHRHLVPPFECRANVELDEPEGGHLEIRLQDVSTGVILNLDLIIMYEWKNGVEPLDPNFGVVLEQCHQRINERFEVLFTEAAKNSFKPIKSK